MPLTVNITQFEGGVTAYNNTTAEGVANYLIWLCGKFGLEAQDAISHTPINSADEVQPFTPTCVLYILRAPGRNEPPAVYSYVPCGETEATEVTATDVNITVNALINSVRVISGQGSITIL